MHEDDCFQFRAGNEQNRFSTKRRFPQGKCHSVECEKSERKKMEEEDQKGEEFLLLPDDYREVWRMEDNFVINEIRNSSWGGFGVSFSSGINIKPSATYSTPQTSRLAYRLAPLWSLALASTIIYTLYTIHCSYKIPYYKFILP